MFERPGGGEKAVLVQLDFGEGDTLERLEELKLLAGSAGAITVAIVQGRRERPDSALYAGKGKVAEVAEAIRGMGADIAIFNHELSAAQQRNLEKELGCRVVDRTSLILDIFAQRARSHEGKLQVELAQLQHMATRLVRGWTHLERQKGGIGLRGPGETQLETDRRLLGKRVKVLKDRLKLLGRQRAVRRRARTRREMLAVSLVGYTNAGKSTLFNALTKAGAYAADKLFATLDTTSRRLYLDGAGQVVLSDTVGFIRDLPHSLVAAFHATLEETASADLLLHVIDSASADRDAQIAAVNSVLEEIGAAAVPQILVWNKIDVTGVESGIERDAYGKLSRVRVSAKTGAGLDLLRLALAETAQGEYAKPVSPAVDAA
ncbi:MAG: GTPase HflX [Candidatus Desulfobacillus denitrificans]|jgi:GTP-binding protein HflX|uniref:GTPase HflX n=1 Tax=Candidatus Desulfobacillus denitrificans TaxID=2608985 RepID=A0A809S423_9PROT|nr:GTPase HflX [Rhodocyclaceae bacterium]MCZ2175666.1 GTPase HflX [Burkholderiales bacterium]OQY74892.1 MAG: GTPase HflX [Rhodocyclaceae bacterium UTPRO2]BBO20391.1 GTPase HflX [Candidatus Desulfobacillus denitrificans]GIK44537.1 MAG: GTPase HflX [Betaproteobacteria bacterium]